MHHLARLARFDDQRDLRARAFAHQMIVHRRQRQQARNRSLLFIDAAVGKNQQRIAVLDRQRSPPAQPSRRAPDPRSPPSTRNSVGSVDARKSPCDTRRSFSRSRVGQNRMRQLQRVAVLRRLVQNVALGADVAGQRHHQLFANRIDRRIRHLREQLLEVVEQRLRLVATDRPAAYRCPSSRSASSPFTAIGASACADLHRCSRTRAAAAESSRDRCRARAAARAAASSVIWFCFSHSRKAAASPAACLISSSGTMRFSFQIHQQHPAGLQPAFVLRLLPA